MTRISSGIAFRTTGATVTSTALSSADGRAACTGADVFEQPPITVAAASEKGRTRRVARVWRSRRRNCIAMLLRGRPPSGLRLTGSAFDVQRQFEGDDEAAAIRVCGCGGASVHLENASCDREP